MAIDSLLAAGRIYLALSGDVPGEEVMKAVAGVGLIRSEYVLRRAGSYVTTVAGRAALAEYACAIAELFAPRPVWLRTSDFEAREIATLDGCDARLSDDNPILGERGVRRGQRFPQAFLDELGCAAQAARRAPNLGLLFSYVPDAHALDYALGMARKAGWTGPLGSMVETPSAVLGIAEFLRRPLSLVVFGMNDLTSLFFGAHRGSTFARKDQPALLGVVARAAQASRAAGVCCLAAGNFERSAIDTLAQLPVDGLVLHHYELPQLLPGRFSAYRDLHVVPEIKATTAKLLAAAGLP